ncbi:23262_t:CDS:2, partial [Gigaspora rosea]
MCKKNLLKNFIETINYTCDTTFYGISDLLEPSSQTFLSNNNCNVTEKQNVDSGPSIKALFSHVFVNTKLTCSTPMEVPYFSSRLYPDVCFQCGDAEILSPTPAGEQL